MDQLTIVLIILALTIIAFMSGKLPYTVISMGIIIALIMTGIMTIDEAFSGLTNSNVIMFAAMFVIGAGIVKSGLLDSTKNIVMRYQNRPKIVLLVLMLVATVLSILTSAVGTMAILLPLIINIANNLNISRSKFIYPVAMIANIATACTFLGQGAANMNWSDVMVNMGGPVPFGIWDFTIARIPVIVTTIIYGVFVSQYLLPDIPNSQFDTGKPVVEKTKTIDVKKQRIAQIICSFTIIGMIVLDYFSLVPMYIVACIGAVLLILFGVLSEMDAISSIHGPTMFLFIGVLPLSDALKMTGAADVVASLMRTLLGNTTNPYIIMAVLFVVPLILTQVMSNIAAVAVFVPLVCSVAVSIGIDPRAGVMAVLIASCTSILTPMAAAAQAMILAPGGYSMKDYLKCGFPLVLINTVVCIVVLPILFPF